MRFFLINSAAWTLDQLTQLETRMERMSQLERNEHYPELDALVLHYFELTGGPR